LSAVTRPTPDPPPVPAPTRGGSSQAAASAAPPDPAAEARALLVARFQILAAALLFSTGGAAIKATTLSSWQVAGFRSGIAFLVLPLLLPGARRLVSYGWGIAGVGVAYGATLVLFVGGTKLTTAANTIFLQSTAPLYLLGLAPWLLHEKVRRRDLAYMAALAVGLALFFVGQRQPDALAPDPFTGNLLGAAAGVTWGFTLLGLRAVGRGSGGGGAGAIPGRDAGAAAVVVGNLFAFLACLPAALPHGGASLAQATAGDWTSVVYLGVFQIGAAYYFLTRALRHVGALEASLLLLVEPVLNPVWTWLFHGETPGPWGLAGGVAILGATLVKTWFDYRRARA
jgi:drug/metabolite transporter (DMT)-like permease